MHEFAAEQLIQRLQKPSQRMDALGALASVGRHTKKAVPGVVLAAKDPGVVELQVVLTSQRSSSVHHTPGINLNRTRSVYSL